MKRHFRKYLPDHRAISDNPWLRPFRNTLLHPRLWHLNRHSAAGAVAAGLFCGLIPGPFQMLGAALCAVAFRVNLPLAMLVTLYTNPLTLVPLYLLAYHIGRFFLTEATASFQPPPPFNANDILPWVKSLEDWMIAVAEPLGLGLVILASSLAVAGYFIVKAAWIAWVLHAHKQRRERASNAP